MDENSFPILIQLQKDLTIGQMTFHKGDQLIFNTPDDLPSDVPFVVIQTQCTPRIEQFFERNEAITP